MSLGSKLDSGFVCSVAPLRNWRTNAASAPGEAEALPPFRSTNAEQTVPANWGPSGETLCGLFGLVVAGGAAGVTANRDPAVSAAIRMKVPTPRFMNPPLQRTLGILHFTPLHSLHWAVETAGDGVQF
jgi:hypothetical protein